MTPLGTCRFRLSSKPGDVCGLTLLRTNVMGWPGHASRPRFAHYPVVGHDTTSSAAPDSGFAEGSAAEPVPAGGLLGSNARVATG